MYKSSYMIGIFIGTTFINLPKNNLVINFNWVINLLVDYIGVSITVILLVWLYNKTIYKLHLGTYLKK